MKFRLLENLEERFYFKTSLFFWHLLTGLAGLVLIGGALAVFWGLTPSTKPPVKKTPYPEPVKITAEDVKLALLPAKERPKKTPESIQPAQEEIKPSLDTTDIEFLLTLQKLKKVLPTDSWESKGHWEETWGEKKWVVDVLGVNDMLRLMFERIDASNFGLKQKLVEAYISLVIPFPMEHRLTVLKSAMAYSGENIRSAIENVFLLCSATTNFSTDSVDFIELLAEFGVRNPRDGRSFITFVNELMPAFTDEIRRPVLRMLVSSYYTYFNNVTTQKEATHSFLNIAGEFNSEDLPKVLNAYYRLYQNKNFTREERIRQIETTYKLEQGRAELVLLGKKVKKAIWRAWGWKLIASCVVFIAFVAMFLVLLSMQRNIRIVREYFDKIQQ